MGSSEGVLEERAIENFIAAQLADLDLDGRSLCLIIPDGTRSCPLSLLVRAVHGAVHGRVAKLTALIALGTHAAMSEERIAEHLGVEADTLASTYPDMTVINHEWWDPDQLVSLGSITEEKMLELSDGRLSEAVEIRLNRHVIEHDVVLIVGPVFPHEVVGFSGGNKYLFPGVAAQEIIDISHWLGALISNADIIGTRGITPVRAVINEAAAMVPTEATALCVVVRSGTQDLHAIAFGDAHSAWSAAAEVSADCHIRYLDQPVDRIISLIPEKYEDMWTGAKGFYKVEPVVRDGGQVILVAPHISEFSVMHPELNEIGYHNREYFEKQWEAFGHRARTDLAHSTHLRGAGTYDEVSGERNRVTVTLATSIPEDVVRAANLDYLDPASVDVDAMGLEPGTLVIHEAGEVLYRLRAPGPGFGDPGQ